MVGRGRRDLIPGMTSAHPLAGQAPASVRLCRLGPLLGLVEHPAAVVGGASLVLAQLELGTSVAVLEMAVELDRVLVGAL